MGAGATTVGTAGGGTTEGAALGVALGVAVTTGLGGGGSGGSGATGATLALADGTRGALADAVALTLAFAVAAVAVADGFGDEGCARANHPGASSAKVKPTATRSLRITETTLPRNVEATEPSPQSSRATKNARPTAPERDGPTRPLLAALIDRCRPQFERKIASISFFTSSSV